jgi:hypothetical protein
MNDTTGEIENIKKDFKAIQIEGVWYSSFKPITDLQKGQTVKLVYTENKGFKNIKTYEIIPKNKPTVITKEYNISDTTFNTILMCSKEIYLNFINKGERVNLKEVTEGVIESYKLIRKNL